MKKVFQTKKDDCFRACIASILGCFIDKIPDFTKNGHENFHNEWSSWEKDQGLLLLDVELSKDAIERMKGIAMIAVGKSPRNDFDHAVIVKNNKLIHDPHKDGNGIGIEGKIKYYTLILNKDPSLPVCPICLEKMVKSRIQCVDGSGYMFGWLCGCNEEIRGKK